MMISTRHRLAFVCVPKCASTSVEKVLRPFSNIVIGGDPRLKHLRIDAFKSRIEPLIAGAIPDLRLTTFCIVREPVSWVYSWYCFRSRPALGDPGHLRHHAYAGHVTFDEYAREVVAAKPAQFARIGDQSRYVCIDGELAVDRVFRLDRLPALERFLSERFDKPIAIPAQRVSEKRHASLAFDTETSLRHHFASDYCLYERAEC